MNKAFTRVEETSSNKPPLVLACRSFTAKVLSGLGYVSRLIPPSPGFKAPEVRMASKVKRLATNSFDTDSAYQVPVLGGPKLHRSLAYMIACITRVSLETLSGFVAQHTCLVAPVFENECLADSVGNSAIPNGWDSRAFCSTLLAASSGDLAHKFILGTKSSTVATRGRLTAKFFQTSLQRAISETLSDSVPAVFEKVFTKRFKVLGIRIEHLQCFKADQFGYQNLATGVPRLSRLGQNIRRTGTSFLGEAVPGPLCQSLVVPGATFGHNFSLCRPSVLDTARVPLASRPSLPCFPFRIDVSARLFLHAPSLSWLFPKPSPMVGSQPTEQMLKTMGAHDSLVLLVVRISLTP